MAKRKAARATGRKAASSKGNASRTAGAKAKKAARKSASRKAVKKTAKKTAKKRAGATARKAAPKGSARKTARKATTRKAPAKKAAATKTVARKAVAKKAPARPVVKAAAPRPAPKAQPARKAPALDRARRTVVDDDIVQTPPSSLDLDRSASAARSGRRELAEKFSQHNESSPALTAGDVDADWEGAYASGDEAPGGDNPTPDQDIVDDIGKAVGNVYQDNEELKGADKITKRDKHRWELDPASAEDYDDRE